MGCFDSAVLLGLSDLIISVDGPLKSRSRRLHMVHEIGHGVPPDPTARRSKAGEKSGLAIATSVASADCQNATISRYCPILRSNGPKWLTSLAFSGRLNTASLSRLP